MPLNMNVEAIESVEKMGKMLADACQSRCLVHILAGAPQEQKEFVTRFQDIAENGDIIVEPLTDKGGGIDLSEAGSFSASYVFKFNKYEFDTSFAGLVTAGTGGMRLIRPPHIRKMQMRNYYRLPLDEGPSTVVVLSGGNLTDAGVEASLMDISEGGLSCSTSGGAPMSKGSWVGRITFSLPNGYAVNTAGTVKRVTEEMAGEKQVMVYGLEFGYLDTTDRFALVDFIFEKQREMIRRSREVNEYSED